MNVIFNYLRGDEYKDVNSTIRQETFKQKLESLKIFLKYLCQILKLLFPSFVCASTFLFFILLIDIVALEFVVYRVGLFGGKYYKILSNKDYDSFWPLAATSICYIIVNALMKSVKDFVTNLLGIVWRKYITFNLHDLYFMNKNFYYLQYQTNKNSQTRSNSITIALNPDSNENEINNPYSKINLVNNRRPVQEQNEVFLDNFLDNPDQRITQDVNSLCNSIAKIVPLILISPFVIGWYGYQAFNTVGYSGPLAVFIYFIFWSMINGPLTSPIARVIYKQDKKEGDFRFGHVNLRINAESIAFYDSSKNELNRINREFDDLLNISYRRNWKELILKIFINTSQYMGGILAYLVLAIPIFTNKYDDYKPADLAQLISNYSFKCQYLIYLFTRLYDLLSEISIIAGNTKRVGELYDKMSLNKFKINKPKISKNTVHPAKEENEPDQNDQTFILVENLTVKIPDTKNEKILIKNLNFKFKKDENVLISGRSGCGKTSLFRCINGLWNNYTGQIKILNENSLFFLPQNSYFTSGSLLEQIIYPSSLESNKLDLEIYNEILDWLNMFRLGHILDKVNSNLDLKPDFNWSTILSSGEKQRLSFLRLLFHKPKYALLDEFTSSVDQETETLMYEFLQKINCTFISIAHRDTVRRFHQKELKFLNDSNYEIITLGNF
nr:ATP-binding cassette transporter Abcd4 [Brachionus angularis]